MKLMHLADLHFGKLLHGLSLTQEGDQRYWMEQALSIAGEERPDAVLIAGDVYDRSVPPREAVQLLDEFLSGLCALKIPVLAVAGNHDSGDRLSFLSGPLARQGVHIAGRIGRELQKVTLRDAWGETDIWLLPYFFKAEVQAALGLDEEPADETEACRLLLSAQAIDGTRRNVLVMHQLVLANGAMPVPGGSETLVGGLGAIDASCLDGFDYVALGHIHRAQSMGSPSVRYAGAPLYYHFGEVPAAEKAPRGILFVELLEKGSEPRFHLSPTRPLHRMRNLTGALAEVEEAVRRDRCEGEYLHVHLTDDTIPPGAAERLRTLIEAGGGRLLLLDRAERRFADPEALDQLARREERSEADYFRDFYRTIYPDRPLDGKDDRLIDRAMTLARQAEERESGLDEAAQALIRYALRQEEKNV
ncbi:MAG: exonuclease SbcCD subunit D [Clostridia bacterium]|nr:exonuclease SbcCD subunit D [Clostridia bacterium]